MLGTSIARKTLTLLAALALSACAMMPQSEPVQVTVAGIDSLPGEGLEFRMLVKLRVQNPNDSTIDYDGVYLKLEVLDKPFATGVSDERGSIPRYSEAIVTVPLTVSVLRVAFNVLGIASGQPVDKVRYRMDGKLNGPMFGSTRFQAEGELSLPGTEP